MTWWASALLGELLARQNAGWFQPQLAGQVTLGARSSASSPFRAPPPLGWTGAIELTATGDRDRSAALDTGQVHVRLALLPGLSFSASPWRLELAAGPALGVRRVSWRLPVAASALLVEPGLRARAAVVHGWGPWGLEIGGGGAWRSGGGDYDAGLGVRLQW